MKTIDLSRVYDLRRTVRYSVSPLFEMALSLRQASQPDASADPWVDRARAAIRDEGLMSELQYFSPIFSRGVPAFFSPQATERLTDHDGPYSYIAGLSPSQLAEALTRVPDEEVRAVPLRQDLARNPHLVKGRFTLFISAYLRLVFEPIWEQLQPLFLGEIERRNHQLSAYGDVETFVTSLLARQPSAADAAERGIVLHPSWFHSEYPYHFETMRNLHVVYPLARNENPRG